MAKKQTTSKKSYPETVIITFNPQFSAATSKTLLLREEVSESIGNTVKRTYKPLIEGLPQIFTVHKGEEVEITADQFIELYKLGFVDGPRELNAKRNEFYSVGTQSGVDPTEHRSAESLSHLYEDKLIRIR